VGRPWCHDEARAWEVYAFDERERMAAATTEIRVILEMARCLREIGACRWLA
jgi:hypothetical protein